MAEKMILVYITCRNEAEAKKIAARLVMERLAGCCNIVPKIKSIYRWKNKLVEENEALLLCKTKKKTYLKLKSLVEKMHSYDVPSILWLPFGGGNKAYLDWLDSGVD